MATYINLKQAQATLMKKSLYDFILEMWDAYETAPYSDCWLVEWQSECFMYSLKHFLPRYVWQDWIDDFHYEGIKKEANAVCDVRDKMFNGKHVRNHNWNMPPRHMKLLADDTPVLTRNGLRNHGDLKVGDEVLNEKGEFVKVICVHPKDIADKEVVFSNGERIKCNGEHLWDIIDNDERKTLKTIDIENAIKQGIYYQLIPLILPREKEILIKEINDIPPVQGNCITVENSIYLVGMSLLPTHNSSIMNVCGPVWAVLNTPISVASVSHTAALSSEMNTKRQRLLESEKLQYYYGAERDKTLIKSSAKNIQLMDGSQLYSVCMASFTGFGADCFPAGTKILTPFGYKNIEDLLDNDKIISYNTKCGEYNIDYIQATRRIIDNEFIKITTTDNRTVESTPDHRYWVIGRGYVKACDLKKEDCLLTETIGESTLQNLWNIDQRQSRNMQTLYIKDLELSNNSEMRTLWENIPQSNLRFFVSNSRKIYSHVLFSDLWMSGKQLTSEEREILSCLWKTFISAGCYLLLTKMFRNSETTAASSTIRAEVLQTVWGTLDIGETYTILFERLCQQISCNTNDRYRQFSLQIRKILSESICKSNRYNSKTRQLSVSDLWAIIEYATIHLQKCLQTTSEFVSASYRPEQTQQFVRQFSYIMCKLSCQSAQEQKISSITQHVSKKVVYDIQVSNNHNFFANGILVHNCIIADDILSSDNAVKNMQIVKNALSFFRNTLPTRRNSPETGVIWHIQQRLAPGDITGLILDSPDLRSVYSSTKIQAIATEDINFIYPCSGKVKEIHKGDSLWQERFGDYSTSKAATGTSVFNTQYQQEPSAADSTIIKPQYIHYMSEEAADNFIYSTAAAYASHDCPVKDNEANDNHGFVRGYGNSNTLLITEGWEAKMGFVKEKELIKSLYQTEPEVLQIIEDKANGAPILQDLKLEVPGLAAFNPGTHDKTQRLQRASTYVESGAVQFIKSEKTDYLIDKLLKFPFLEHDDVVDAFSQLVIYHFTKFQSGIYTNCFTTQNIIITNEELNLTTLYAATMNGAAIKVLAVNATREGRYIAIKEYIIGGLKKFEEFAENLQNQILDASYENSLYGVIKNPKISLIKFHDRDRDKSINLMKTGFYKKQILIDNKCVQSINDINKFRIKDNSLMDGTQVPETLDEGFAGCLRAIVTYYKGIGGIW